MPRSVRRMALASVLALAACGRVATDHPEAADDAAPGGEPDTTSSEAEPVEPPPRPLDLPGDPLGPTLGMGPWVALGAPLLPHQVPTGRVSSGGTMMTGYGFLFRSMDGAAGVPFVEPADVLRLGARDANGLFFDPASVSAAGGFLLDSERGLFRAAPSATRWTRLPCPPSADPNTACGRAAQTASGAIVLLRQSVGSVTPAFRTTDEGATWTPVSLPYEACSIASAADTRVLVYCSMYEWSDAGPDGGALYGATLLSTDDGRTFRALPPTPGFAEQGRALSDRGIVSIGARSIRLSKDGGATWTTTWASAGSYLSADWPIAVRGARAFVIGREDGSGEFFLLRSRDGGETWARLTAKPPVEAYTPRLAIGDGGRVDAWEQRSDDDGETWKADAPVPTTTVRIALQRTGAVAPGGDLWAAARKLFRSTDGGLSWKPTYGGYVSSIAADDATGAIVIGSSVDVLRTVDAGASWTKVAVSASVDPQVRAGGGVVVLSPGASYSTFAVSVDGGLTWKERAGPQRFDSFAVSATGTLYAIGTGGMGVSTDRGVTWAMTRIPDGLAGTLEVAPSGELFVYSRDAIFRSKDAGKTWGAQRSAGLPSERREVLTYARRAPLGVFFARGYRAHPDGIDEAVLLASIDGGASFHPLAEGLHPQHVLGATFDGAGRLFAATVAGVYRSDAK